ncbi:MAG: Rne/Rng family ribonuclease [Nocardioides sp.]|uniref:Rne/Rng family ribonuclease n=1 Tax=Nocardioides sp. TaxID=35761 RepID=UPI0039E5EAAE
MLDEEPGTPEALQPEPQADAPKAAKKRAPRKRATAAAEEPPAKKSAAKKSTAKKSTAKKAAAKKAPSKKVASAEAVPEQATNTEASVEEAATSKKSTTKKAGAKKASTKKAASKKATGEDAAPAPAVLFQAPEPTEAPEAAEGGGPTKGDSADASEPTDKEASGAAPAEDAEGEGPSRRRRRRGGRRRRKPGDLAEAPDAAESTEASGSQSAGEGEGADADEESTETSSSRRRRRRRRSGEDGADASDDSGKTGNRARQTRSAEDQITAVSGSTRLEAKKQRRREGRESGRRRAPIVSEAEFLARRESVERVMVIRERQGLTQIAVLEDKVLVEHYVARESQTSLIGNVYLGRVQNVLPSMEAAFIDIGRGRNAVLYAGEVNWSALGHPEGQPRKIEAVLSSGQAVMVQVTKDPVGHKGARLTSQISLAGRFLVYVPDGTTSGISRKLPDTERNRLKTLLKEIVPDTAGVIVRTAAEGASEDELTRDVERLKARWEDIEAKAGKGNSPQLLYGEPDLTLKVVRDLFTEDFAKLVIEGDDAWETVQGYVAHVAPDLETRLERYQTPESGVDVFGAYRIDEQIAKGLDRKVWLPSGGSLIIDRTEAMTVVDVNTGKFTGSGGNLEETVTKNNLEAAEEIVRQLRLRDIGGIIVIDFIDMVLESNRELVLRRLVECLGRDRTRHQVAEVTSLGLVQMTRKRIGTGLLEAFSETCEHCGGRGLTIRDVPVETRRADDEPRRGRRRRGRGSDSSGGGQSAPAKPAVPSPKDLAAVARPEAPAETPPEAPDDVEEITADIEPAAEPEPETEAVGEVEASAETEAEVVGAEPEEAEIAETVPAEAAAELDVVESAEVEAPVEPAQTAPKVTSRSRRRSATRPAGPPAVAEPQPEVDADPVVDLAPGSEDTEDPVEEAHAVEHVPIKRRSRKR